MLRLGAVITLQPDVTVCYRDFHEMQGQRSSSTSYIVLSPEDEKRKGTVPCRVGGPMRGKYCTSRHASELRCCTVLNRDPRANKVQWAWPSVISWFHSPQSRVHGPSAYSFPTLQPTLFCRCYPGPLLLQPKPHFTVWIRDPLRRRCCLRCLSVRRAPTMSRRMRWPRRS